MSIKLVTIPLLFLTLVSCKTILVQTTDENGIIETRPKERPGPL